jgi:glycosyltransferase involved in cell wall biosynthesis
MALKTATVMSPVGVNCEIISNGENGFLADSVDDWVEKLSKLIEDESLRKKFGKEGRKTVIKKYSMKALSKKYVDYFHEAMNGKS